jgi:hypothetical protein
MQGVKVVSDDKKATIKAKLSAIREETVDFVSSLTDDDWQTMAYDEGSEWTVADMFRHIVDSERGMVGTMNAIRKGGEGVPADFDLARWNRRVVEKLAHKTPLEMFEDMGENRIQLFAFIDELEDDDWSRQGRHASLRIMTIEEICHLIGDHEQGHVEVMRRAVDGNR